MSCDKVVSSASYYGDELRKPAFDGFFVLSSPPTPYKATKPPKPIPLGLQTQAHAIVLFLPLRQWGRAGPDRAGGAGGQGPVNPVSRRYRNDVIKGGLQSPWLWRGGLAHWSAFRDRLRGASAPPSHSRWAACACCLGCRGSGLRV